MTESTKGLNLYSLVEYYIVNVFHFTNLPQESNITRAITMCAASIRITTMCRIDNSSLPLMHTASHVPGESVSADVLGHIPRNSSTFHSSHPRSKKTVFIYCWSQFSLFLVNQSDTSMSLKAVKQWSGGKWGGIFHMAVGSFGWYFVWVSCPLVSTLSHWM